MDAPREVKAAIFLSWIVVVIETADRLWRISIDSYARALVVRSNFAPNQTPAGGLSPTCWLLFSLLR
jgi:hypothetical protein